MPSRPFFLVLLASTALTAETRTQQQMCNGFSSAVVGIDAGGQSRGTGFLVSPEGFLLTASHVVRDENNYHTAIDVTLSTGEHVEAKPAEPITGDNVGQDYALLKVSAKHPLPFLLLGSTSEVNVGDDATIIGFPYSAISARGNNISTKFCLAATFAAVANEVHPVSGTKVQGRTQVPFSIDVHVDVIYFQGPSVKGLSGSPVISRETGHVVGILSTKLSAISQSLGDIRQQLGAGGADVVLGQVSIGGATVKIIDTLDQQLANGLGSAVGVEQASKDLHHAQHQKQPTR